jgi:hypothetical protein
VGKLIFWIVIVFGVLFALRLATAAKLKATRKGEAAGRAAGAEVMVRCQQCGVFLPRADALSAPDGYRCQDANCINRRNTPR